MSFTLFSHKFCDRHETKAHSGEYNVTGIIIRYNTLKDSPKKTLLPYTLFPSHLPWMESNTLMYIYLIKQCIALLKCHTNENGSEKLCTYTIFSRLWNTISLLIRSLTTQWKWNDKADVREGDDFVVVSHRKKAIFASIQVSYCYGFSCFFCCLYCYKQRLQIQL